MDTEFDVVIAGGGIAGMTAAVTAARLGRKTLVLTGDVPGGQLISIEKIDELSRFPRRRSRLRPVSDVAGPGRCSRCRVHDDGSGAPRSARRPVACDDGEGDILARAVIVATGSSLKKLDIPGEQRLTGNGVSECASCDAPLLRDRIVAVVGGGDLGNAGGVDARRVRFESHHSPSRRRLDGPGQLPRSRRPRTRKSTSASIPP